MQEERKDEIEEVEAPEEEQGAHEVEDDEIEAHSWKQDTPQEFSKFAEKFAE